MRFSIDPRPRPLSSITSLQKILLCLSASIQLAQAGPYPKDDLHDTLGSGFLVDRSCATYCGVDNQYCCAEGQACTTNAGIAGCTDTALGGGFGIYTTTWTETDTYTSTISSYYPATTGDNGAACVPPEGSGQKACGSICCASWQYCAYDGQCSGGVAGGGGATTTGGSMVSTTITTSGTTITTQYSAPYRVTSGTTGTGTTTSTGTIESATSTGSGNGTAVTTGGNSLSGGAIAGIVIGVIAGVVILLAICACCIMRGLWHGLLAIFGLGPGKKRKSRSRDETIIVEEERYSRHGSAAAHSRRDTHGGWFAAKPPRSAAGSRRASGVSEKRRESSSNAGWWGAGALGTMALLLGLRRDKKRKEQAKRASRPRSDVSSSYFSDSYTASSPSEFSSDYTYSSVYTRPPQPHAPPVQVHRGPPTVHSASGAGRERDDYFKSNVPPEYAGSASSGGRTRDTRRSRRTETTRISRAPSRR
ncbi:hypothetical protein J7T55_010726 [Diaporthe amygdali]|uniref:uncharacterized protein n=1 Tax=Phomopsis amygdali TaxID=1214568 RepID=UPI0022FEB239|nr:uncharacterized protein J7T55_010726 [Diaporthe amygdali]KAJ0114337.1 hypothetical protein J7T55_010726 [Diaporthe amygdali]